MQKCLLQNSVIKQKMCKKKLRKLQQIIHFWKAFNPGNANVQKFSNLNVYSGELKMCKFPLKASVYKSMQNFFAKYVQPACFQIFVIVFPKSYKVLKSNDWK